MTYEDFLISLSDISAEQAYEILLENPNHEHKSSYKFIIKNDPLWAYFYAKYIIEGRWTEGEEIIKTSKYSCDYAKNVIKDRWIEAEEYIKKDPESAYYYARDIIKDRWIEAEEIIKKDSPHAHYYAKNIIKDKNFWD